MMMHLSHHEGETCVNSILDSKAQLQMELAKLNHTSRRRTLLKELWKINHPQRREPDISSPSEETTPRESSE